MGLREMANIHSSHKCLRVLELLFLLSLFGFLLGSRRARGNPIQCSYNTATLPISQKSCLRPKQAGIDIVNCLTIRKKLVVQCLFWLKKTGALQWKSLHLSPKKSSPNCLLLKLSFEDCSTEGDDVVQLL